MPSTLPGGLKELKPVGYLGIDFGTSNTHIAICYLDGNNVPQTVPLAGKASLPTCLLWKARGEAGAVTAEGEDDKDVVAFGVKALQNWLTLSEDEKRRYRFAAGFKPDIATGSRAAAAQRDALAFLRKCYQAVRDGGVVRAVGSNEGVPICIGVPAEIGREQKEITARLARDAGFGNAVAVEEPLGALAFHLADGSVTAAEARRGVVVVDFGGGTLDIALLDARHGLCTPWGDPTLGGRLFDDLFYQWLLEQNPGLDLPDRDQLYVWQVTCRDLKELFSSHWKDDGPDSPFVLEIKLPGRGHYAEFRGTVAGFFDRACRYTPSQLTARYFAAVGSPLSELGSTGTVDLIGWIRRELARGFRGPANTIARVILTGGSSSWPFMRNLAAETFGVEPGRVLHSLQPEVTIGSGLAVYHVLKHRNGEKRLKLTEELPGYKTKFKEAAGRQIDHFAEQAAEAVVTPLIAFVEATYVDWYRNGGTLRNVNEKIQQYTNNFDVAGCLKGRDSDLAKDLVRLIRDHLRVWLKEHGIEREANEVVPDGAIRIPVPPIGDFAQDVALVIAALVAVALVGTVFMVVYFAVHGTHILVHPLTGLPVAAASALLTAMGYTALDDYVKGWVMDYNWGSAELTALSAVLSEKKLRDKINESRQEATQKIVTLLRKGPKALVETAQSLTASDESKWNTLDGLKVAVVAQFEQVVAQVIKDLGVLEEIRKAGK